MDKKTEKILDYLYFAIKYDNSEFESKIIEFLNEKYSNDYDIYVIKDKVSTNRSDYPRHYIDTVYDSDKNVEMLYAIIIVPKKYSEKDKLIVLNAHIDKVEHKFRYIQNTGGIVSYGEFSDIDDDDIEDTDKYDIDTKDQSKIKNVNEIQSKNTDKDKNKTNWIQFRDLSNIKIDPDNLILTRVDGNPIGGDDRSGVAIILYLLDKYRNEQNIVAIFTNYEESGCIGSSKLQLLYNDNSYESDWKNVIKHMVENNKVTFLIGLDRKGNKQFVNYGEISQKLRSYFASKGFEYNIGSISDVKNLSKIFKVDHVNLSVGFENAHTDDEKINVNYMLNTIDLLEDIIENDYPNHDIFKDPIPFQEKTYTYYVSGYDYHNYDYSYGYYDYDEYISVNSLSGIADLFYRKFHEKTLFSVAYNKNQRIAIGNFVIMLESTTYNGTNPVVKLSLPIIFKNNVSNTIDFLMSKDTDRYIEYNSSVKIGERFAFSRPIELEYDIEDGTTLVIVNHINSNMFSQLFYGLMLHTIMKRFDLIKYVSELNENYIGKFYKILGQKLFGILNNKTLVIDFKVLNLITVDDTPDKNYCVVQIHNTLKDKIDTENKLIELEIKESTNIDVGSSRYIVEIK